MNAVLIYPLEVAFAWVALVGDPVVLGVVLVQLEHDLIAVDLRYDACGGDTETLLVALLDKLLFNAYGQVLAIDLIDQDEIGTHGSSAGVPAGRDRAKHGNPDRGDAAEVVHFSGAHLADTDGKRALPDRLSMFITVLLGDLLAVVDVEYLKIILMDIYLRKDDARRDEWSCDIAYARLVDTGNEGSLTIEHLIKCIIHRR